MESKAMDASDRSKRWIRNQGLIVRKRECCSAIGLVFGGDVSKMERERKR